MAVEQKSNELMIENKNKANCYDENWPNFDVMVAKALEV